MKRVKSAVYRASSGWPGRAWPGWAWPGWLGWAASRQLAVGPFCPNLEPQNMCNRNEPQSDRKNGKNIQRGPLSETQEGKREWELVFRVEKRCMTL